ncbi:endolysin [Salmonella phage Kenya-K18]|uniref:Endolysin n=2 Tax=Tequintavirus TaxID=187218 RepID=A0AAF0K5K5_9CAUD|nr:endolysin [Salmonella phage NR01]AKN44470.1 putative endolysin [Salmonella phage NR01]WCZ57402.1 endolysin [Salmonella phage Kenya-K18]WGG14219.1 endolysin [Salmonella phage phA11]WGG14548.1 endolysin [Salmonella phage phC11]
MSFKFSKRSLDRLKGVHPDLVRVTHRALELSPYDFTITEGLRSLEQSAQNIKNGTSFLKDPSKSKHVQGRAIDFAPLKNGKIDWNDLESFKLVADAFFKAAEELGVKIRWGGDWNQNGSYKDEIQRGTFDGPHIELI